METVTTGEACAAAVSAASAEVIANPFPGLRPFREDEGHLFFGRESQVDIMIDKLAKTRFLAVVGTSGSGKSSLVNCGLRPALHRGLMTQAGISWRMVQFRPGSNPLHALAVELSADGELCKRFGFDRTSLTEVVETTVRTSKFGLSDVYERTQLNGNNLLIVVDQFEELFRYRDVEPAKAAELRSQEAMAFVNLLLDAKGQSQFPIYVVLTMRSDFLGDCAEFPGLPEAINEAQYLIPRLTRDERRAAIAGPVGVGGGKMSPVLLTQLVNDLGDNPDQLSILQHALNRTWACWESEDKRQGLIELLHYNKIGTMLHALDQHAEEAYHELRDERQQKTCSKIFKALTDRSTDPRGVRRPTKFGVLCGIAQATAEDVAAVIDVFRGSSRSFLMPPLPQKLAPEDVVDISHESFMRIWERLRGWIEEEVQSARLYRRLTETAALKAANQAGLWNDPALQLALDWRAKEEPTESWANQYRGGFALAMEFLDASEMQREQERLECEKERLEKEELRKRDLQQVRVLAVERGKRIRQQGRWLGAMAGVVVLLLAATFMSLHLWMAATLAHNEAKTNLEKANTALKVAEERRQQAEAADNEMRMEALRVRDKQRDFMVGYLNTADSLSEFSSPELSVQWERVKGEAYLQLGNYERALPLLSDVLKKVPDDLSARTDRGYLYLLTGPAKEALKDFQYIHDRIDANFALNNLNMTLAQAELGDYHGARGSLQRAVEHVQYRHFDPAGESVIPPEITRATGRTSLEADNVTFAAALRYMQANLEAAAGDGVAFKEALSRADTNSKTLTPISQKDAYLIAITWAWLHLAASCPNSGDHCKDYGALASQAALWERAGFKDWAACYYKRFQDTHQHWGDPRYTNLAQLVDQNQSHLKAQPAALCLNGPEPDALTLETEARKAASAGKFDDAGRLYQQALLKAPGAVRMQLMIGEADALLQMGIAARRNNQIQQARAAFLQTKNLCDQMLQQNPRQVDAYFYRAAAQAWIDQWSPSSRQKILADLHQALRLEPSHLMALQMLDDLTPGATPEETINYLEQYRVPLALYYRMSPYTASVYLHRAMLAKYEKRYDDALKLVDSAIAMSPEDPSIYQLKMEIQLANGVSPKEADQDLKMGYLQALTTCINRGHGCKELLEAVNEYKKTHQKKSE